MSSSAKWFLLCLGIVILGLLVTVAVIYKPTVTVTRKLVLGRGSGSPINDAIESKASIETIRKLLDKDPSLLEVRDDGGLLPLQQAARYDRLDLTELLLNRGADVNARAQTPDGDSVWEKDTALMIAVQNNDIPIVRLLLKHNADPSIRGHFDALPLDYARQEKNAELVTLLGTAATRAAH